MPTPSSSTPPPSASALPAHPAGPAVRDIRRKIAGHEPVEAAFEPALAGLQIRSPARVSGWKLYSFHAPEVQAKARQGQGPRALGVRRECRS